MNDVREWKIPKWPFLLGNALLLAFAYLIVWKSPHPISKWEILACFAAAALGAVLGILPFLLDYRAMGTALQVNALGAVADKIQDLEKLAAQISAATNQWDVIQAQAEKTAAGAKQIADKMGAEVREFSEFMQKINDSEKATLRLEVEKMHRGEAEWLQMLVRIFDHIFALARRRRAFRPAAVGRANHPFPKCLPRHGPPHWPDAVCRRTGRSLRRRPASGSRFQRKSARRRGSRRNHRLGLHVSGETVAPGRRAAARSRRARRAPVFAFCFGRATGQGKRGR